MDNAFKIQTLLDIAERSMKWPMLRGLHQRAMDELHVRSKLPFWPDEPAKPSPAPEDLFTKPTPDHSLRRL